MGVTPNKNLRYPASTDAPDGPGAIYALAMDVEAALSTAPSIFGTDLNTVTVSGIYVGNNFTNSPDGTNGYFYIQTISSNADTLVQLAYSIDASNLRSYRRFKVNGTWYPWDTVATSTNLPQLLTAAINTSEPVGAFAAATGWTIDSQYATKLGPIASVGVTYHRSGGSITIPSNGSIANQLIATFRTGWVPAASAGLPPGGSGPLQANYIRVGTGLQLNQVYPYSTSIANGDTFSAAGLYLLAAQ